MPVIVNLPIVVYYVNMQGKMVGTYDSFAFSNSLVVLEYDKSFINSAVF